MNCKQIASLLSAVYQYVEEKYNIPDMSYAALPDNEYLEQFTLKTKDVTDVLTAMFILPDGKLKRFELDLTDFPLQEVYTLNFGITNENIYSRLNIKHEHIQLIGFDLQRLLDLGCIRIGNNKANNEVYLQLNLKKKLHPKVIDAIEYCLLYYKTVLIDYLCDEELTDMFLRYSAQNGDTIKDVIYDLNKILLKNKNI